MKMRTLRRLQRAQLPRQLPRQARRREFDVSDATMEPDPGPPPEAVFDRLTGPYGRRMTTMIPGIVSGEYDEET